MDVKGIYSTIENHLPPPVSYGYEQLVGLGRAATYWLGRSHAIDNLVRQQHDKELQQIEDAEIGLRLDEASTEALGELAVLRRFIDVYGPTDQTQLRAIDISAEPEPLALKLLDRMFAEEMPEPPRPPHIPQARRAND